MQSIQILNIAFDTEIAPYETPAFRGAVIERVGVEYEHYHNHDNNPETSSGYHYRYPLIQYKRQRRRPAIVFINEGIEEARHFFGKSDWQLDFAGRSYQANISKLKVKQYKLGVCDKPRSYVIRRWAGLNQQNYEQYIAIEGLRDQISFLEQKLAGHILGFASAMGHRFERKFEVIIQEVLQKRVLTLSGVKFMAFDLRFKADVLLPPSIGLGRGVSRGFGVLNPYFSKTENKVVEHGAG
ncbi:MAG: CRISPR-associated endonuclease Cas6 [Bacteroidota bacterium]